MNKAFLLYTVVSLFYLATPTYVLKPPKPGATAIAQTPATISFDGDALLHSDSVGSNGTINIGGQSINYHAVSGTIVVHPAGWDDAAKPSNSEDSPEAAMSYVAYFKRGGSSANRPVTYIYNGGPGASSVWLHMGAFGPQRLQTSEKGHTPAAPYHIVENAYCLLDASDLVFIDAPGTGFGRIAGKNKEKAFFGVDADASAFGEFIKIFMSRFNKWNVPKYLMGESYGGLRSAVLVNNLQANDNIDFNGVIFLSQVLSYNLSANVLKANPGYDEAYVNILPSYAATAWYHNRIAGTRPKNLEEFLHDAEQFASGAYATALQVGSALGPQRKQAIAEQLAHFTGLPVTYILKANLRVEPAVFLKMLQDDNGFTTSRLDVRFFGFDMDPLSKDAEYDPLSAAISSAYMSSFNDYSHKVLGYGKDRAYKPDANVSILDWNYTHQSPGASFPVPWILNALPDLAYAMKTNPDLKIMINGGYFDLATPFYEGWYELHHLQIPESLNKNIEYHYYESGHQIYVHEKSLRKLHDNVAAFIKASSTGTKN